MARAPVYTKDAVADHVAAGRLIVGPHTYGAPVFRYWGSPGIYRCRIGDYCSIADQVQIYLGGYHRPERVSMYPFPSFEAWPETHAGPHDHTVGRGDVSVGSDVWLGSQCVIMSGCHVGHGAVVAARAVVTKDVPPYAVVAGNPGRIVKYRFDEATIADLLAIAWWDWPVERVRENLDLLMSSDMQAFIARNRVSL